MVSFDYKHKQFTINNHIIWEVFPTTNIGIKHFPSNLAHVWRKCNLIQKLNSNTLYNYKSSMKLILALLISLITAITLFSTNKQSKLTGDQGNLKNLHRIELPQGQNSTTNITNDQFMYMVNSIAAAERKYSSYQYDQIAQAISVSMKTVQGYYWNIFVFDNGVTDLGIKACVPYYGKTAVILQAGTYRLNYVFIQISNCPNSQWTTNLSNSKTTTSQTYGSHTYDTQMQLMKDGINSASVYAGDDLMRTAQFLQSKVNVFSGRQWNVVVSTRSTASGSYVCMDNSWGKFIRYADFNWNYFYYDNP